MHITSAVFHNIIDFFFPRFCVICSNPVPENKNWFCSDCESIQNRKSSSRSYCPLCGADKKSPVCVCQNKYLFPFDCLFSFFSFDSSIQRIIHNIKYKNRKSLAEYMGYCYFSCVPEKFFISADYITEVPLHFLKKTKRGYNQAEYFAGGICRASGNRLQLKSGILQRKRYTKTQTKLDSSRRKDNVKGVFRITPRAVQDVKGKNIILVDDVVTTGATVSECSKVLLSGGAKSVRVLSLARA